MKFPVDSHVIVIWRLHYEESPSKTAMKSRGDFLQNNGHRLRSGIYKRRSPDNPEITLLRIYLVACQNATAVVSLVVSPW